MLIKRQPERPKKKRKLLVTLLLILAVILFSGYLFGSLQLKKRGYPEPFRFSLITAKNYLSSLFVETETVRINVLKRDWNKIKQLREKNLERGMIFNEEESFVPAELEHEGRKIEIKLRLKGHMTDHIESDKWSFRIMTKGDGELDGMRVFTLQHPGTRAYAYEWVYHQLMKRENIIALRYKFLRLILNGEDKGIYSIEENFGFELLENNKRVKGPILRFDPDLYWVDRYNELIGDRVTAEYSTFSSAFLEPFRNKKTLGDTVLKTQFEKASALMETFRRGEVPVSAIFDLERLARFHAIIDLVGGHHSLDWSDVKYYFNPVTQKLEPIAYESFSVNPVREISGSYKFKPVREGEPDLHQFLFSDPEFFKAYIHNLERIASTEYLDAFFSEVDKELDQNVKILYKEFPYKIFDRKVYYRNQESIRKIIETPKAFHSWVNKVQGNNLEMALSSIESLPVVIQSVTVNDQEYKVPPFTLSPKQRFNKMGEFVTIDVPVSNVDTLRSCTVNYSLLGSTRMKSLKSFLYAAPVPQKELLAQKVNISNQEFLEVDKEKKTITFSKGTINLKNDLVIPDSFKVMINAGTKIFFSDNVSIVSYSPFIVDGSPTEQVLFAGSPEHTGLIFFSNEKSTFRNCTFIGFSAPHEGIDYTGGLTFYETTVEFSYCTFKNFKSEDAITLVRTEFVISDCEFNTTANDAVNGKYSKGRIINSRFVNNSEDAVDMVDSDVRLEKLQIDSAGNKGINFKSNAKGLLIGCTFGNCKVAISAEDGAAITGEQVKIDKSVIGILSFNNKQGFKGGLVNLNNSIVSNTLKPLIKEKNSILILNGRESGETVSNAEKVLD